MESTSTSPVRTVDGVELPAAGTWRIDPGHAEVAFVGRHFGLTRIRGRFTGVSGEVVVADDVARSSVTVEIDMATVSSGDVTRDDHLRSADLFDVEAHPTAAFRSTGLVVEGRSGRLAGELTLKGVTRPVTLEVEHLGHARDPWGNDRAVFSASTTIDREDWGLTWNMVLEAGGLLVSKRIRIEVEVELVRE
jgi:polyisoprenoid-binding protein YceI